MTSVNSTLSAHLVPKNAAYNVVAAWSAAFTAANVDAIAKLYTVDATMIGTFGTVVMTRPEQIRNYFDVALNKDRPRTATLNSSEAVVLDDNTVMIAGFDTVTSVKDGQPVSMKGRVTFVVAKRGADWMIVHLHRSPMPAT
jgi:uncharacterized protein (TIGR02246 family)